MFCLADALRWLPQIVMSVPLAPALLAPLLASSIPHRLKDRDTQVSTPGTAWA